MTERRIVLNSNFYMSHIGDKSVLWKAIDSLSGEAFDLMRERTPCSSVPPFLGELIKRTRREVAPQIPLRRDLHTEGQWVGPMKMGVVLTGGSSLLPTVSQETAYRIFDHQFPTETTAIYALAYCSAIAHAKHQEKTSANIETAKKASCIQGVSLIRSEKGAARTAAREEFEEDLQRWESAAGKILEATLYFGGLTLLMESIAEAPPGLLNRIRHLTARRMNKYPSAKNLQQIRVWIDRHFNDKTKLNKAFLEAMRLRIPLNDF